MSNVNVAGSNMLNSVETKQAVSVTDAQTFERLIQNQETDASDTSPITPEMQEQLEQSIARFGKMRSNVQDSYFNFLMSRY